MNCAHLKKTLICTNVFAYKPSYVSFDSDTAYLDKQWKMFVSSSAKIHFSDGVSLHDDVIAFMTFCDF